MRGRKKVFVAGLGLFAAASLFSVFAPNIEVFILLRFLQGSGTALIYATSVAILTAAVPGSRRGTAMGVMVSAVYIGLTGGTTLGGFLVSYLGWRWIFLGILPVVVAALIMALVIVADDHPDGRQAQSSHFDWPGSAIYMAALFAIILGATRIEDGLFFAVLMTAGFGGMIFFFYWENHADSPILDIHLIKGNRVFALSNMATLINYAAAFGVTFFFSLYLQQVKGLPPKAAGLILIAQPLTQAILSPLAGKLADRMSPPKVATSGMALCTAALLLCSTVKAATPIEVVVMILVLMGIGFAFFSSPNITTIMGSVAPPVYGIASSLVSTMRTLGMLVAMTLITLLLSTVMGSLAVSPRSVDAYMFCMRTGFLVFSGLGVLGIFCSMGRVGLHRGSG